MSETLREFVSRGQTLPESIGGDLQHFGGFLRCETCGYQRDLGDVGEKLRNGWPKHCGYTMRWWTARQVAAGEVPELGNRAAGTDRQAPQFKDATNE